MVKAELTLGRLYLHRGFVVVCRDRTGSWQTLAALSPSPLPGAKLAALKPPGLLLAALGNQLKKHSGLISPGTSSGESVTAFLTAHTCW